MKQAYPLAYSRNTMNHDMGVFSDHLEYNHETGQLRWRQPLKGRKKRADWMGVTPGSNGRTSFTIDGFTFSIAKIVHEMATGRSVDKVYHIGDKNDNRYFNLSEEHPGHKNRRVRKPNPTAPPTDSEVIEELDAAVTHLKGIVRRLEEENEKYKTALKGISKINSYSYNSEWEAMTDILVEALDD